jgi:hypothetical protein
VFTADGDGGIRTHDPQIANLMLSQLSYAPGYRQHEKHVAFVFNNIFPVLSMPAADK